MRVGAGLDNGKRVRRGNMDAWQYIYSEHNRTETNAPTKLRDGPPSFDTDEDDENEGLVYARRVVLEPHLRLPSVVPPVPRPELPTACDPEHPRIYHMFWAGPFTDKPHLALLSYLFTQNLGLNVPPGQPVSKDVCRPQFWVWINPGPAASVPNPNAWDDMYSSLKANPWSSPFLHPRFEDVIKIKMWNTTEQLDSIPEIKDDWRNVDELFNSGGHKFGVKVAEPSPAATPSAVTSDTKAPPATLGINVTASTSSPLPSKADRKKVDANDLHGRLGSSSQNDYDRLSVVLSDMVRFVLTHRFGGIYLDADTILLRDWEELWGWKGAFAYRWSRLETYNTAVLHMNKRSALGSFLFRTALRNGLDFHPMTVSRYMKEAYLEGLLLRLPDALFDSAWLNVEWYQRDRPAFPYFTECVPSLSAAYILGLTVSSSFHDLFTSAAIDGAGPLMLGFEGFFRGAFSYHFHNFW
jgi:WD repeat and SOF domain-containing protein 1